MTSITFCNLGMNLLKSEGSSTGDPRKRVLIFIKGLASAQKDTLASYVPGLAAIEGVLFCTVSDAVFCGNPTWTGTLITYPNKSGAALEMCVVGRLG